jgi:hypothetical protein
MIHFSCDRCKRPLDNESDLRYVVRLEVQAVMDPCQLDITEDDRDHLVEIQDMIERLDDDNLGEEIYQKSRYDLCSHCYRKFIQNPLGRESVPHLNFSKN